MSKYVFPCHSGDLSTSGSEKNLEWREIRRSTNTWTLWVTSRPWLEGVKCSWGWWGQSRTDQSLSWAWWRRARTSTWPDTFLTAGSSTRTTGFLPSPATHHQRSGENPHSISFMPRTCPGLRWQWDTVRTINMIRNIILSLRLTAVFASSSGEGSTVYR